MSEESKKNEIPDHYLIEAYATSKMNSTKLDILASKVKKMELELSSFRSGVKNNISELTNAIIELDDRLDMELEHLDIVITSAKELIEHFYEKNADEKRNIKL